MVEGGEQAALVADADGVIGEFVDHDGAAYKVQSVACRRQLEHEAVEVQVLSLPTTRSCWLERSSRRSI